jgi:hypothetical protein
VDSASGCRRRRMDGADELTAPPVTIAALARTAELSDKEQEYLEDMSVLRVTPDAFLAPGVVIMRLMLQDGLRPDKMDALMELAADAVDRL